MDTPPSPIRERAWTDAAGTRWLMRGDLLHERALRRLLKRPGVRILHVYGTEPVEPAGPDLALVLARLDAFLSGRAAPMSDFRVGDFRDPDRNVLVVIEEYC